MTIKNNRRLYPDMPRYWRAGTAFSTSFLAVAASRPTASGLRVRDPGLSGSKNTGFRVAV